MAQLRPLAHRTQQSSSRGRGNPSSPRSPSPPANRRSNPQSSANRQGQTPIVSTMQNTPNPAPIQSTEDPGTQQQATQQIDQQSITNSELLNVVRELQREMTSLREQNAQKEDSLLALQNKIIERDNQINELEHKIKGTVAPISAPSPSATSVPTQTSVTQTPAPNHTPVTNIPTTTHGHNISFNIPNQSSAPSSNSTQTPVTSNPTTSSHTRTVPQPSNSIHTHSSIRPPTPYPTPSTQPVFPTPIPSHSRPSFPSKSFTPQPSTSTPSPFLNTPFTSQMPPNTPLPTQIPSMPYSYMPPFHPYMTVPPYSSQMPPSSNHDTSKAMISAFKTIKKLQGKKMESFNKWKENVAINLSANPQWAGLVVNTKPAEFIPSPAPTQLLDANRILYSALNSAMDDDAKDLIDDNILGGLELLESLTKTFSPTLTVAQKQLYLNEILNPKRFSTESPIQYYLRIKNKQRILDAMGEHHHISPTSYILGLNNVKQKLLTGETAFDNEVRMVDRFQSWPATWQPHSNNLLNLAAQIQRDYNSMRFREQPTQGRGEGRQDGQSNQNDPNYRRTNKVTQPTSMQHRKDFMDTYLSNPTTFFTTGWGSRLLRNTDPNICIFHGLSHPNTRCLKIKSFLPTNDAFPAPTPPSGGATTPAARSVTATPAAHSALTFPTTPAAPSPAAPALANKATTPRPAVVTSGNHSNQPVNPYLSSESIHCSQCHHDIVGLEHTPTPRIQKQLSSNNPTHNTTHTPRNMTPSTDNLANNGSPRLKLDKKSNT